MKMFVTRAGAEWMWWIKACGRGKGGVKLSEHKKTNMYQIILIIGVV